MIVAGGLFGGYPKVLDGELACAAELIKLHRSGHRLVMQSAFALSDAEPVLTLRQAGIVVLPTIDRVAMALSRTVLPATSQTTPDRRPSAPAAPAAGPVVLPVADSFELLRKSGISLPPISVVRTPRELATAAATATYPACVKIADTAVAHKSDIGGVFLNLADAAEAELAARQLWARFPGSPLLLMPSLPGGTEFLVGTGNDPVFGPFVVVGKGGIWTETDADLAILMTPVDEKSARQSSAFAPLLAHVHRPQGPAGDRHGRDGRPDSRDVRSGRRASRAERGVKSRHRLSRRVCGGRRAGIYSLRS